MISVLTTALLALAPGAESAAPAKATPASETIIYGEMVYTSEGEAIKNGAVVIADGKITAILKGKSPSDDDIAVKAVTAGLVDLSAHIDLDTLAAEQSSEVTPTLRAATSLDFFSRDWDRMLRAGVTTVVANPPDYNVISGMGVALKTGGERNLKARLVKSDVLLRGAFGQQPSRRNHPAFGRPTDVFSRRPTTRMGVEWVWRKSMFDAAMAVDHPELAFPGHEVLREVLAGKRPLVVQAWATQDIRSAVFMKEEMAREGFGEINLIIDAGAEAWKEPDLLVRSKTSVVLPPLHDGGRAQDGSFMADSSAQLLVDAGLLVALSSHNSDLMEDRLFMQAAFARRGGLDFEAALATVTINPARMVGIDDRVGSIAVGKDADLTLWNGEPFEATSRVVGTVLNGELVVDPR